jgi:hypothetical protein
MPLNFFSRTAAVSSARFFPGLRPRLTDVETSATTAGVTVFFARFVVVLRFRRGSTSTFFPSPDDDRLCSFAVLPALATFFFFRSTAVSFNGS